MLIKIQNFINSNKILTGSILVNLLLIALLGYSYKTQNTQELKYKSLSSLHETTVIANEELIVMMSNSIERTRAEYEETIVTIKQEFQQKITKLTQENASLKKTSKKVVTKTKTPDGTITERTEVDRTSDSTLSSVSKVETELALKYETQLSLFKESFLKEQEEQQKETKEAITKITQEKQLLQKELLNEKSKTPTIKNVLLSGGVMKNPHSEDLLDLYWKVGAQYKLFSPVFLGGDIYFNKSKLDSVGLVLSVEL